jgi:hypothetical protein
LIVRSNARLATDGSTKIALVSVWAEGANVRNPSRSRLVPVDELVTFEMQPGTLVRATMHGMASDRVEVVMQTPSPLELQLYPVLEATVELKDVATQGRPVYDRYGTYLHPLKTDPSVFRPLALSDEEEAHVGLKPFRFQSGTGLRESIPQWFAMLDYSGRGSTVNVPVSYDIPGYEETSASVTAAAPGMPNSLNVVWLTPTGKNPSSVGALEISLLDHRGLFFEDGPALPGPGEILLEPTATSAGMRPVERTIASGMGRTLLYEGIPEGEYRLYVRGPDGFGAFPSRPEGPELVRIRSNQVATVDVVLDSLPALELADERDLAEVAGESLSCFITKDDISQGASSKGVSVHFKAPPYRLPVFPEGEWFVTITAAGRSYGPHEVQIEKGAVAVVAFGAE